MLHVSPGTIHLCSPTILHACPSPFDRFLFQAVVVLVGYFVLGPTELYKLTKEIGKALQNFRSLSTEASKQFETSMEDQLDLQELRKAQRELDDAFNFRRSINTDETAEAFDTATEEAARAAEMAAASGTAAAASRTHPGRTRRSRGSGRRWPRTPQNSG